MLCRYIVLLQLSYTFLFPKLNWTKVFGFVLLSKIIFHDFNFGNVLSLRLTLNIHDGVVV